MFVLSKEAVKVDIMRVPKVQVMSYNWVMAIVEMMAAAVVAEAVALATVEMRTVNEQEAL